MVLESRCVEEDKQANLVEVDILWDVGKDSLGGFVSKNPWSLVRREGKDGSIQHVHGSFRRQVH